jgi:hypothetical protein
MVKKRITIVFICFADKVFIALIVLQLHNRTPKLFCRSAAVPGRPHRVSKPPRSDHIELKQQGASVYLVQRVLFEGGGRGRPRSDRRASLYPVRGLLFDEDGWRRIEGLS